MTTPAVLIPCVLTTTDTSNSSAYYYAFPERAGLYVLLWRISGSWEVNLIMQSKQITNI